jgi:chloramphenicol 3-O-phosphotransferase
MTLAELAHLVDVDAKWVLNALAALGRPARYSMALARRLAVTNAIQKASGASLALSFAQAEQALRLYQSDEKPIVVQADDAEVAMLVDVHRILSSFNVRLSLLRTSVEPRQRGRPRARRGDALCAAEEWGIDLSLLADNVGKTVEHRIRQLDAMAAFARTVRRAPTAAS